VQRPKLSESVSTVVGHTGHWGNIVKRGVLALLVVLSFYEDKSWGDPVEALRGSRWHVSLLPEVCRSRKG
jgi:hypothetical protein